MGLKPCVIPDLAGLLGALIGCRVGPEPGPFETVPVLRRYMAQIRVTRLYFDAAPDSLDDAIKPEPPRHPVFQLTRADQP